jgi:hypothetical protein
MIIVCCAAGRYGSSTGTTAAACSALHPSIRRRLGRSQKSCRNNFRFGEVACQRHLRVRWCSTGGAGSISAQLLHCGSPCCCGFRGPCWPPALHSRRSYVTRSTTSSPGTATAGSENGRPAFCPGRDSANGFCLRGCLALSIVSPGFITMKLQL